MTCETSKENDELKNRIKELEREKAEHIDKICELMAELANKKNNQTS